MINKILLNQKYEIDGLFYFPWGECYGTLYLNPNNLHLEIIKKLPNRYKEEQLLIKDFTIRGESLSYGKIIILDPIVTKVSATSSFVDDEKLVKINISFMNVLFGDYLDQPSFKTVRLFIDGTKEWLKKSDREISEACDQNSKTATEVFNVLIDKNLKVKNSYNYIRTSNINFLSFEQKEIEAYIQFDFEEKKSVDEIKEISFQWLILQSLLSGLYTRTTKIMLHNEKMLQIVGGQQIKGENSTFLYYSQRSDRDFDDYISNASTWHQKYLGNLDYDKIIKKWFLRTEEEKSIGNLFYSSVLQTVFTPDKFLNMARSLEGCCESKVLKYIKEDHIKTFREDAELQKSLGKYIDKPKNFLKKISVEKNSLQDRIKLIVGDVSNKLLDMICWNKVDASRIVKLRNDCSHWQAGCIGGRDYVKDSTELFYKMMFIMIYIQLRELEIPENNIVNFIATNQKYSPIISDYLQRSKSSNVNNNSD